MSLARYLGGKTSPANTTVRSCDRSNLLKLPKHASRVSTDGTEYQTETRSFSSHCAIETGKVVARSGITVRQAPAWQVAKTSNTDRSKWSGAGLQTRSSEVSLASAADQFTNVSELRWEIITPFGVPVDPDV